MDSNTEEKRYEKTAISLAFRQWREQSMQLFGYLTGTFVDNTPTYRLRRDAPRTLKEIRELIADGGLFDPIVFGYTFGCVPLNTISMVRFF